MTAPNSRERILPRLIEEEMQQSFINYSMSVIVSRALPDVRDGLKPVHRRILYAMYKEGNTSDKRYIKCAGVVGEVMRLDLSGGGDALALDVEVLGSRPVMLGGSVRHRVQLGVIEHAR